MTEEQYIRANTTKWDKISNNLFMWPVLVFALEIARLLLWESITGVDTQMSKTFFGLILLSFIIAVPMNMRVSRKIARLREQYRKVR